MAGLLPAVDMMADLLHEEDMMADLIYEVSPDSNRTV